ncbi:DUF1592 domain-containing protein [Limnoglobus roseus]|uniref:DUF1592 domain-containing protein n=1 Tax=Limnoglobus roseus TaxID=2598579 RepID=UPI001FE336BD|nr:DUF1592 domain-containing protein [Limnoglobus roseus]
MTLTNYIPNNSLLVVALIGLTFDFTPSLPAADEEAVTPEQRAAILKTFRDDVTPFLKNYCMPCHGDRRSKKGDVSFIGVFGRPGAGEFRKVWQMSSVSVNEHAMPPEYAKKQPTDEERKKFVGWIPKVKYLNPKDPGAFVIRRLNKVEYGNTLRDLLGVDPSVAKDLPDEVPGEGYLNTLSPLQTEQYLVIANEALNRALGPKDGPSTEKQQQLFGATPPPTADPREAAKKVARSLARNAYRRPASDEEIDVLLRVFDLARENKLDYPASLRLMLKAILVSPQFLFITPAKEHPTNETIVPLDDFQLASRVSYFLWSTMPDAELSALADQGKLNDPATLRSQVKRMLLDKRSRALFDGFGAQWLGISGLREKRFDPAKFPEMTPALRTAMYDEVRLFFDSIVRENRSVRGFIESDYTFVNESLAKIYGLKEKVSGPQMRRVQLADPNRGGILGMPGTLAMTSFPERTSAVKRGAWVLEQLLGEHIPPPPPNVPELDKQDKKKVADLTQRQRTELHRSNTVCANCHKVMDPIGFGLENFDAIGRWREKDESGGPIDAGGELPGGKKFSSPKELKAIIAERKEDLVRNVTEKLLAYALCRQLEGYDVTVVDRILEHLHEDDDRVQTMIVEVVTSYPFTHRRIK